MLALYKKVIKFIYNYIEHPCSYCKKIYLFRQDSGITKESIYFCSINCVINDYANSKDK
jgi:hypothetical protein